MHHNIPGIILRVIDLASIPVWCRAIWHFTIYCTQRAQITRFHLVIPARKTRPVKRT